MSARLHSLRIDSPGRWGLNDSSLGADDPRWLQDCDNVVFGSLGHLETRRAIDEVTTTGGHNFAVVSIFEYIKSATSSEIIHSADLKLYRGTTTLTNITGTITTPTANDWQFVNFNSQLIGVQQGHTPIYYTGSPATFTDVVASSGTLPTGNAALSAFGRLWVVDSDKVTIKFSDVLDETQWASAGAGSINTLTLWPDGFDTVTALAEQQNRLLIIGTRSTLIFTGPEDPTASTFQMVDIVRQGTTHRDSVVTHANDVYFLNLNGLQSITRAIQYENLPQASVSPHTSRLVHEHVRLSTTAPIKGAYLEDLHAVCFLVRNIGSRRLILFDVEEPLPDGTLRMLEWSSLPSVEPSCIVGPSDGITLFGKTGGVAEYSPNLYTDAFDVNRAMKAQTAPFHMRSSNVKVLKEIGFEGVAGSDMTNLEVKAQADGKGQISGTGFDVLAGQNVLTTVSNGVQGIRYDFSFEATVDGSITLQAFTPRFKLARGTSYGD